MALLLVLLVVVPIIELYVFIQVSNAIGFLNALGIVILISIFGCWLVKRAGTKVWARFNEQLVAQRTGGSSRSRPMAVSYTHLTLPTN